MAGKIEETHSQPSTAIDVVGLAPRRIDPRLNVGTFDAAYAVGSVEKRNLGVSTV